MAEKKKTTATKKVTPAAKEAAPKTVNEEKIIKTESKLHKNLFVN